MDGRGLIESHADPIESGALPSRWQEDYEGVMNSRTEEPYDVVIVGGGPGGLSAALALGRGRKRVLLCDSGPRRNAAATHIHNFVTRDGTPPEEFRAVGRQQLAEYPNVTVVSERVSRVTGTRGAFEIAVGAGHVQARRLLLCTGMVDEMPAIPGFRELWGHAIFQCPYCHGWEIRDRRWGYFVRAFDPHHFKAFSLLLRGWTRDVVVFTNGVVDAPEAALQALSAAGVRLETQPVARLVGQGGKLEAVELSDGTSVPCDALFTHPAQRQVELVSALGVALEDDGFVRVDPMTRETSVPGVYAAGDLATRMQGAIMAAATATQAATMINMELTAELVTSGGG